MRCAAGRTCACLVAHDTCDTCAAQHEVAWLALPTVATRTLRLCRSGSRSTSYSLHAVGEALRLAFNGTAALPTPDDRLLGAPGPGGIPRQGQQGALAATGGGGGIPPWSASYKVHVHLEKSKVCKGWHAACMSLGGLAGCRLLKLLTVGAPCSVFGTAALHRA